MELRLRALNSTPPSLSFACSHVLARGGDARITLWFTGEGMRQHYACGECAAAFPREPSWFELTPEQSALLANSKRIASFVGTPSARVRATNSRFEHERFAFYAEPEVLDARPLGSGYGTWIALLRDGTLARFDARAPSFHGRTGPIDWGFEIDAECKLTLSRSGAFAAVTQRRKPLGAVVRRSDGSVTYRANRGSYYSDVNEYPIAFFEHKGRELLVCASDWNRLEIIDPATGANLTERVIGTRPDNGPDPEHYLDYFHGSLVVSPSSRWVLDTGWHWHPVGSDTVWSLDAWMRNAFESEDGPTRRAVRWAYYLFDAPAAWFDDDSLWLWGFGNDDAQMLHAALLYSASKGELVHWFAGPECDASESAAQRDQRDRWLCDRWLFAVSERSGLSVWDTATGERIAADSNARPWRYDPSAHEFITLGDRSIELTRFVYEP